MKLGKTVISVCLILYVGGCGQNINSPNTEKFQTGASTSKNPNGIKAQDGIPRNIVVFIGDGMGVSTVTAGRIYAGQKRGLDGESHTLAWEDFPEVALIKTYNHDAQVPDSAGTATAMLSGYRARIGQVNVTPDTVQPSTECDLTNNPTLLRVAKDAGKRVGVISTARITHATPAAVYGHIWDRGWESPDDLPDGAREIGCTSLAEQLATAPLDLVLGGGAGKMEGVDLSRYAAADDLEAITLPAIALYGDSHMDYEADRQRTGENQPSLAEMTAAAMRALDAGSAGARDDAGYVLMVEAGRIDHAHHNTNAYRALEDLVALDAAVAEAKRLGGTDTLIVVTADHSHVFTQGGYPARGNPILGRVHAVDPESRQREAEPDLAEDGRPYTSLSYANGPVMRADVDYNLAGTRDFREAAGLRAPYESHSGEDVPLYARGPGAERFGGVMDQPEMGQTLHALIGGQ